MPIHPPPWDYPCRVGIAQNTESRQCSPFWSHWSCQSHRASKEKSKFLHQSMLKHKQSTSDSSNHKQPEPSENQALFSSLQTQRGLSYSWHNTNRFIISFTKYCYIEILISEHSSDKMNTFIHHCCLCKPPNHSLQKQYYVREKKIHKDIHMLWSTNSTCRDLSKGRIWFCRIIKKTKIIISCCCFGRTVLRC